MKIIFDVEVEFNRSHVDSIEYNGKTYHDLTYSNNSYNTFRDIIYDLKHKLDDTNKSVAFVTSDNNIVTIVLSNVATVIVKNVREYEGD